MRTVIAGSRSCTDLKVLLQALETCPWTPSVVLCGLAAGADTLGKLWARQQRIPVEFFVPEWKRYGKAAGMLRNVAMAERAEALIALWDGRSPGTKNMIELATAKGLRVHLFTSW